MHDIIINQPTYSNLHKIEIHKDQTTISKEWLKHFHPIQMIF